MVTDFKTTDKDSDLFDTLLTHFGQTINLAQIKFLSKMLKAIVILRTVNFAKLATAFGGKADALFGMSSIDCLVADREFVGCRWVGWLNDYQIRYHLRIRENFWVHNPSNGKDFKAFWAFLGLGVNTLANRDVLQIPKIQRVHCRGYSSCRHPKDRKTLRRAHNRFLIGLSRRYFQRPIHQAYQDA